MTINSAALSETNHHQRLSFLDDDLASANLSQMHTARDCGPAWRFPVRDVINLKRHFAPPLFLPWRHHCYALENEYERIPVFKT